MLEARNLQDLSQVTKKKKVRNAIRLHFDRFAVQEAAARAEAAVGGGQGTVESGQAEEEGEGERHRRGLSSSLSSTVTSPVVEQEQVEGPGQGPKGPRPQVDVVELFTSQYMVRFEGGGDLIFDWSGILTAFAS